MVVLLVGGAAGQNRGSGAGSRFPPTPLQLFTMTVHLDDISFLKLSRTQDGPKDQNILEETKDKLCHLGDEQTDGFLCNANI